MHWSMQMIRQSPMNQVTFLQIFPKRPQSVHLERHNEGPYLTPEHKVRPPQWTSILQLNRRIVSVKILQTVPRYLDYLTVY